MVINKKLLTRIMYGSAFLGSGGGGKIAAGIAFIKAINGKKINLLTDINEKDGQLIACIICDIGSITEFDKNQVKALEFAFEALSKEFEPKLGRPIQAFFPIETGPENTLAPFVLASKFGFPVIDGDGAGRAVPTLPLSTFAINDISNPQPVAISNGVGDLMLVRTNDVKRFDVLLRSVANIEAFSNSASLALWPATVLELSTKSVMGSITKALNVGQLLEGIRSNDENLIKGSLKVVNKLQGFLIAMGEIIYKSNVEKGAFSYTTTKIKQSNGSIVSIISQNESLIVFSSLSTQPIAVAPDSICYLMNDFMPITNAEIDIQTSLPAKNKKPQRIFLIGVKANIKLRNPIILDGFRKILEELGYAGNIDLKPVNTRPLGSLFIKLKKMNFI